MSDILGHLIEPTIGTLWFALGYLTVIAVWPGRHKL